MYLKIQLQLSDNAYPSYDSLERTTKKTSELQTELDEKTFELGQKSFQLGQAQKELSLSQEHLKKYRRRVRDLSGKEEELRLANAKIARQERELEELRKAKKPNVLKDLRKSVKKWWSTIMVAN